MIIKVPKYVAEKLDGLNKNDFRVQSFKGSGPGGQHRNKNETGIRITHIKTGIYAESSDSKSQVQNRKSAFVKLVERLIDYYRQEDSNSERYKASKKIIRTYHAIRGTVKDHRTKIVSDYDKVLDGDIDCFIEAMK